MKFAVIAAAFSGNKGAAAMLESSIHHLSAADPSAEFFILSTYPTVDRVLNPFPNVTVLDARPLRLGLIINGAALLHRILPPLRGLLQSAVPELDALARADVLLDEGGITFVDGRGKFLIYNVATLTPALMLGTPVVKIAQALGPFAEPLNRGCAKTILPRMAAIVARGETTREHLDSLGLTNVISGADLAFTLSVRPEERRAADRIARDFFDKARVVGFSPSAVLARAAAESEQSYVDAVVDQIDLVTQRLRRRVLLVAHSARADTDKRHNNDLPLCRDIYKSLARPDMVLFPDEELPSQVLRSLIARCDLFVASRFHAMISALATGVPVLVLGWSHKYQEVLEMFGLPRWSVPNDDLNLDAFEQHFSALASHRDQVEAQIRSALPRVQQLALEQIALVLDVATTAHSAD